MGVGEMRRRRCVIVYSPPQTAEEEEEEEEEFTMQIGGNNSQSRKLRYCTVTKTDSGEFVRLFCLSFLHTLHGPFTEKGTFTTS